MKWLDVKQRMKRSSAFITADDLQYPWWNVRMVICVYICFELVHTIVRTLSQVKMKLDVSTESCAVLYAHHGYLNNNSIHNSNFDTALAECFTVQNKALICR